MEIRDYVQLVWRRGWLIIVMAVLTFAFAYGLSTQQTKIYQATAKLNVEPGRPDWGLSNTLKDLMRSYVERIRSYDMAERAQVKAQLDMPPDRFLAQLNVTSDPSTFSIQIDARDRDAAVAILMANTMADVFVQDRIRWNQDINKPDRIEVSVREYARWATLFKPKPLQNGLAGLILGALAGGLLVIVLEWLEADLLRTPAAVEQAVGIAVLGTIPPVTKGRRGLRLAPSRWRRTSLPAHVPRP